MKSHVLDGTSKAPKMESKPPGDNVLSVKAIDSVVFDFFKGLTSANENERVKSGLQLLQHLSKPPNIEKRDKELKYVVRRLIRGVGASSTPSRAGFFTTLVGFFKIVSSEEMDVQAVMDIAENQLHVGKTVNNKEDADAVVGHILTCGALIRSKKICKDTPDGIQALCRTLITAAKYRTYHNTLAFSFLAELLELLPEDQFADAAWSKTLEPELTKPWERQTIHSVHCLVVAIKKFPDIFTSKYLKTHFGGHNLLNAKSAKQLYKLFWENTSASAITHPSYECFGNHIASSKYLESFWLAEVDGMLKSPTKLGEIETLKIFSDILSAATPDTFHASKFLTHNFIAMMIESLKRVKFKKDDALKAFYDAFFEALFKWCTNVNDNTEKVEIIKKLIFYPGSVNFEKYTSQRIIHQIVSSLNEDGVKQIFDVYKDIFLAKSQKGGGHNSADSNWTNAERQCAGYMLQHLIGLKSIQTAAKWRQKQLKFFMVCSLFHTNDGKNIINKNEDNGNITSDLATQMKDVFYASLQSKLSRPKDEKNTMKSLVDACNQVLSTKQPNKFLRIALDENVLKVWNEMCIEASKANNADDKLKLVFDILLLHMGLQLFREPEMAESAIRDLEKCMQKINQREKKKANKLKTNVGADEPEWIEVIIDLFLHLLSHNTSYLRNVVNSVLPHLCDSLSLTAMHQILSVLDMTDGKNPLSSQHEDEDSMDEENNEDKESDAEEVEADADDDDDDELVEEEAEDGSHTDVLRNAVSQVLIGDKTDDQVSVDLNEMDEEEGNRLDEALCGIFKSMMKDKQYKKTKDYRVETTSIMHFRIRVLDLIDIYIQHKPSLLITIEIMITLYKMIEFCSESDLQPLAKKVEKVLSKLTALRHFATVADISESNIGDYLRLVIDNKVTAPAFDLHNRMKAKCCVFLVACSKLLREEDGNDQPKSSAVLSLLEEYLSDFVKLRNPTMTATLLNDVFSIRWPGIWRLASLLTVTGLTLSTRTYRRIQIVELLETLYRNHELIRQDQKLAKKSLKLIERQIGLLVESLSTQDNVSLREFNVVLNVLLAAQRCHTKIPIATHFDESSLCENIQTLRRKLRLENSHSYARFCHAYKIQVIHNEIVVSEKSPSTVLVNGYTQQNGGTAIESDESTNDQEMDAVQKKGKNSKDETEGKKSGLVNGLKKRKVSVNGMDNRKQKRLRKEERMRSMSKGMYLMNGDKGGNEEGSSSNNSSNSDE